MNKSFLKQKQVLTLLEEEGIVTTTKQAFSQQVQRGNIPFKNVEGYKHKFFDYKAVVLSVKNSGLFGYERPTGEDEESGYDISMEALQQRLKDNPTLTDANIIKAIVAGEKEQLKLDEQKGLLIYRSEVENIAFNASRVIRDKILTIPERLSNELATMNNPHAVKELLYKEFAILLDGFSKDSFL